MTSIALTNFQKVRYFNIAFKVSRHKSPYYAICQTDPQLVKLRLDLIEEESKELEMSIQNKDYPEILDALGDILYVVLGAADAFGFDLDTKIDHHLVHDLILEYELDLLPFVEVPFSRKRMDYVYETEIGEITLSKLHLDYQKKILELRLLIQKGQYDPIINLFLVLYNYLYTMAYLFGVNLDQVFNLVHVSNMTKMAKTEEIAVETVKWYQKNKSDRYDSPSYRQAVGCSGWIIYNQNSGKILKSIHYDPVDLKTYIEKANNFILGLGENQISSLRSASFSKLNDDQKVFLKGISRVLEFGRPLRFYQKSHLGLMVNKILARIYFKSRFDYEFIAQDLEQWEKFVEYFYLFSLSDGFHNYQTGLKIIPEFTLEYWKLLLKKINMSFNLFDYESVLERILFRSDYRSKLEDSNNLYLGLYPKEAEDYYHILDGLYQDRDPPILVGLNNRIKKDISETIHEEFYHQNVIIKDVIANIIQSLDELLKLKYVKENSEELEKIKKLKLHIQESNLDAFNDYLTGYISSSSELEWLIGFLDFSADQKYQRKGIYSGQVYSRFDQKDEILYSLGNFGSDNTLIPSKWSHTEYQKKEIKPINQNYQEYQLNPRLAKDKKGKIRKINYTNLNDYLKDLQEYFCINLLPIFKD